MDEERAGDTVSGTYSYVDPLGKLGQNGFMKSDRTLPPPCELFHDLFKGSLIVVTYTAGPMGYQETREVVNDHMIETMSIMLFNFRFKKTLSPSELVRPGLSQLMESL